MRIAVAVLGIVTLLFTSSYASYSAAQKKSRLYLPQVKASKVKKGDGVYQYPPYARGKKGRKYIRRFSLRENLTGDKLKTLETYGYTPHRLRHRAMGKVTERWRYHSIGLERTFDECGNMISERRFPPQQGHID